jgi:hypothetical protein
VNIVNFQNVSITSKWLTNELHLFVLLLDLIYEVRFFAFHIGKELIQETTLVVDPGGLILDLTYGVVFHVGNEQNILNSSLGLELVKRIFWVVSNLANEEPFFSKDLFLVLELIDNLDGHLISRSHYVEGENFFPNGVHVIRLSNDLGMLNLLHIVDHDLYHRLKAVSIKELVIKVTVNYVQCQS